MKPRTKLQQRVFRNAQNLDLITPDQKRYALNDCLEHSAFVTKNKAFCIDCGERFDKSLIKRNRVVCPHCNTKLNVVETMKTTLKQQSILAVGEVYGEFQVIRYFMTEASHKIGTARKTAVYEILQHWILEDGKREVVARHHNFNWCQDSWSGFLEIRNKSLSKYECYHYKTFPGSRFKQMYAMFGINANLQGLTFLEAIKIISENPKAETLVKTKQYNLLNYYQHHRWAINEFWNSIKICIRNKYIVKDASLYIDYLELLKYFKKDLRSPKYLFPKDVKKEHDRLVAKKREIQRKIENEHRKQRIAKDQIHYQTNKGHFFGLAFAHGKLKIEVLAHVAQFLENGDKLKHCVYTNEYYKREESLCFQALYNGELIETIEVSLTDFTILQSRGLNNLPSKHNAKIAELMNKNIDKIKEISYSLEFA